MSAPSLMDQPQAVIMIADDNGAFRADVDGFLAEQGFTVAQAANGKEAVELADQVSPDVILMDLRMPWMNGIEATREIKRAKPRIQIILFTAFDDPSLQRAAAEAGAYCYLAKGTTPQVVVDVIRLAWGYKLGLDGQPVIPGPQPIPVRAQRHDVPRH